MSGAWGLLSMNNMLRTAWEDLHMLPVQIRFDEKNKDVKVHVCPVTTLVRYYTPMVRPAAFLQHCRSAWRHGG